MLTKDETNVPIKLSKTARSDHKSDLEIFFNDSDLLLNQLQPPVRKPKASTPANDTNPDDDDTLMSSLYTRECWEAIQIISGNAAPMSTIPKSTRIDQGKETSRKANSNSTTTTKQPTTSNFNKLSAEARDKMEKRLRDEDEQERSKYINSILQSIRPSTKISTNFLSKIGKYPLANAEMVEQNSAMYAAGEKQLMNDYLLVASNSNEAANHSLDSFKLPSVTRVLDITRSDQSYKLLLNWKLDQIDVLGYDGFLKENRATKAMGTLVHGLIESKLMKNAELFNKCSSELDQPEKFANLYKVIDNDVGQVLLTEARVKHTNLLYGGIVDCLAYYKGNVCLIDWKTANKDKVDMKDLYEYPLQLSAYIGALLNDPKYKSLIRTHGIQMGLIVSVNKDTGSVNLHPLNYQLIEYYWYQWLINLKMFWQIVFKYKNANNKSS